MLNRKDIHDLLAANKIIPVVGTAHLKTKEDILALADALYLGGSRVIEFVLRSADANKIVNADNFAAIKQKCPDMLIGVGTCATPDDIQLAKDIGADFAVAAHFRWINIEKAHEMDLFYLPGVGTLERFNDLICADEKSPISEKTVHELLGGKGVATLKVHPGGATDLIDIINATIMNDYQRQQGNIQFIGLEPSEHALNGFGLREIGLFAKKDNVTMLGGTFPYILPDEKGGTRDLIYENNWDGIAALTAYAMAVTHGHPVPVLPENLALAIKTERFI